MPEPHLALLFPLDADGPVEAVLERFRLEAFLFTETEIWPLWLERLRAEQVPAIMVSGRVSARTARRAAVLRPLYRAALAEVTCCMQTDDDARRILGANAAEVYGFDARALAGLVARIGPTPESLGQTASVDLSKWHALEAAGRHWLSGREALPVPSGAEHRETRP